MKMKFNTEQEAINFVIRHTPFGVRPKKNSKYKLIYPFISHHAFEQVCECIGKVLFEKQSKKITPKQYLKMTLDEKIDKVLVKLETKYGYDFSTDFWTDEILLLLRETIISTIDMVKENDKTIEVN
jgi:hypothetical protein